MWDALPIQRYGDPHGTELECIRTKYTYPRFKSVRVSKWKDVPKQVRVWALEIWSHAFSTARPPIGDEDLLIWIEQTGTLVAKRGVWADGSKSTRMHYVTMNYVVPTRRGRGLAKRMILSMAHELSKTDSSVKFIFELHDVPRSLYTATPFLRFSYVWIPFFASETWLEVTDPQNFRRPGFTPDHWTGFQLFVSNENYVLIDPHDTVVWYDSFDSLLTFDKRPGAYVRWFWPFGNVHAYVENMHFSSNPFDAKLLT
jgi:hypothetical protein